MRNAQARDGSPKVSYAAVTASPPPSHSFHFCKGCTPREKRQRRRPPASPKGRRSPPTAAQQLAAKLLAKNEGIAALREDLANVANDPVADPNKNGPKTTMSTEAIALKAAEEYWVDVNAKTRENVVVVKPGPKPKTESKCLQ